MFSLHKIENVVIFIDYLHSPHPSGPAPLPPVLSLPFVRGYQITFANPKMSYKWCLPILLTRRTEEGRHEEGRRRFRSVLASAVPVLISVVFPHPAGQRNTCVFLKYYKRQLMGPIVLKGNKLEPICLHWLQRVCTVLWLMIFKKLERVRSLGGANRAPVKLH